MSVEPSADRPASSEGLEVVAKAPERATYRWHEIVISVEVGIPTVAHFDRTLRTMEQIAERRPDGAGLLVILHEQAPPPDEAGRSFLIGNMERFSQAAAAHAHVVEGQGFIAAAKRSVITLMFAARRRRFPQKIFRTVDEAVPWLFHQLGRGQSEIPAFMRLVKELRASQFSPAR